MFGEAPEGFDAIDMVLAASELVLMVVNPVMLVTISYQPIIGPPSIGIDITA